MRLLDTTTLQLKYFMGEIPKYAILSHTWEEEEVTFEDMKPGGAAQSLKGYLKIQNAARLARMNGYDYIWIDTCCIDKSSSAELSEAINSMFAWYEHAGVCYAYFSDYVPDVAHPDINYQANKDRLGQCKWFTRGWTLQELIAPKDVVFFDRNWDRFGSRANDRALISRISKISSFVLIKGYRDISAAERMSWAARRVTTRAEDIAYCLLGLFNVNMPLLYGEGAEKAFGRLQQQFLSETNDESIFAWWVPKERVLQSRPWSLLAPTPAYFADSGHVRLISSRLGGQPTDITNRGIRIEMLLARMEGDKSESLYFAPLRCFSGDGLVVVLILQRLSPFENLFTRVVAHINPVRTQWNPSYSEFGSYRIASDNFSKEFLDEIRDTPTMQSSQTHKWVRFTLAHESFRQHLIFVHPTKPPHLDLRFHMPNEIKCEGDIGGRVVLDEQVSLSHRVRTSGHTVYMNRIHGARTVTASGPIRLRCVTGNKDESTTAWTAEMELMLGLEGRAHTPFGLHLSEPVTNYRPFISFALPHQALQNSENAQFDGASTADLPGGLVLSAQLEPDFFGRLASFKVTLVVQKRLRDQNRDQLAENPKVWKLWGFREGFLV